MRYSLRCKNLHVQQCQCTAAATYNCLMPRDERVPLEWSRFMSSKGKLFIDAYVIRVRPKFYFVQKILLSKAASWWYRGQV